MTIVNINLLIEQDNQTLRMAQAAKEELLIQAHHRGDHPWGSMRRDCPFCQK